MQCCINCIGVAALNQHIYVVGGFDGTRQLSSVERYDTERLVWDKVAPIKIARSALSLTVLDGKLFAMGGFDGNNFLAIVEVYDPELNVWEEGTPLTSGRSGHASAVIYQPSGVPNYMDCLDSTFDPKSGGNPPTYPDQNGDSDMKPPPPAGGSTNSGGGSCNTLTSLSGNRCTNCNDKDSTLDTGQDNRSALADAFHSLCNSPAFGASGERPPTTGPDLNLNYFETCFLEIPPTTANEDGESSSTSSCTKKLDMKRSRIHSVDSNEFIPKKIPIKMHETDSEELAADLVVHDDDPKKCKRIFGQRRCNGTCPMTAFKNSLKKSFRDLVSPRNKTNKYCKFRCKNDIL